MVRRNNDLSSREISVQYGRANAVSALDFDEAVSVFIAHCEVKNLSDHTVKYYQNELVSFRKVLDVLQINTEPGAISIDDINEFIRYSRKVLGRSEVSVNTRLRAVRAFFNWLADARYLDVNPVDKLELLRTKRKVVETFTVGQLRELFKQPNTKTFSGVRDYTIMHMLLDTGVRVNELINIDVSDVVFAESYIIIRKPKSFMQRKVPMQDELKRQMRKWLTIRGKSESNALFTTIDDARISKRRVQETLSGYGRQAGIKDVRCSPHTFRHTFAKMSVENGANVFELQQILGHSTLEMVRIYVNLFSKDVIKGHKKFSPLKNM